MNRPDQELKGLEEKYEVIVKRMEVIPEEIIEIEKRMKERERDLGQILRDIEKARQQRQGLLVAGGKVDEVSREIKTLWEKCDLAEDEIVGLKTKVRGLHNEEVEIVKDKESARDEIIRASLDPLMEEANTRFKGVSEIVEKMYAVTEKWGISFGADGLGRFIVPSMWRSFWIIPRLARSGEAVPKDFFNSIEITEKKDREALEKIYKKTGLLK